MLSARIDPHVHLYPPRRLKGLIAWSRTFMPDHPVPLDATADDLLGELRRTGVRRWINLVFPLQPGEAAGLHRFNAELAERCPEMSPFGGVLPSDEDPLAVAKEAIETFGMVGLKFHPMVQRFSPADPALAGVFDYLEGKGKAVFIHTGYDHWFGWHLPEEDIERLVAGHPGLAFVLAHLWFPRIDFAFDLAERYPNVWLDATNVFGDLAMEWWVGADLGGQGGAGSSADPGGQAVAGTDVHSSGDSGVGSAADLGVHSGIYPPAAKLREAMTEGLSRLSHRVMFGTDHPVGMGGLERIYADFDAFGLDNATREQLLAGTATEFLDRYGR